MIKYTEEIKAMNLWEKLAAISSEIQNIQKDDTVGAGNSSYKAVSIEKVVKIVADRMNAYGVVVYPISQEYTRQDERITNKYNQEVINRVSDVNVSYEVVNIHKPEEKVHTVASGTGVDTQDKGVGKAQTYAYKNMLLKLFAIPTGDDPDKIHSDDYTNKLRGTTDTKPQAVKPQGAATELPKCTVCGGTTDAKTAARAKEVFGKIMCAKCGVAAKAAAAAAKVAEGKVS